MRPNRTLVLNLPEVLEAVQLLRLGEHPDDFIEDDAQIRLRRNPTRVEIRWFGIALDNPEYKGSYAPEREESDAT